MRGRLQDSVPNMLGVGTRVGLHWLGTQACLYLAGWKKGLFVCVCATHGRLPQGVLVPPGSAGRMWCGDHTYACWLLLHRDIVQPSERAGAPVMFESVWLFLACCSVPHLGAALRVTQGLALQLHRRTVTVGLVGIPWAVRLRLLDWRVCPCCLHTTLPLSPARELASALANSGWGMCCTDTTHSCVLWCKTGHLCHWHPVGHAPSDAECVHSSVRRLFSGGGG